MNIFVNRTIRQYFIFCFILVFLSEDSVAAEKKILKSEKGRIFYRGGGRERHSVAAKEKKRRGRVVKICFLVGPLDDSVAAKVFRKVGFKMQQ